MVEKPRKWIAILAISLASSLCIAAEEVRTLSSEARVLGDLGGSQAAKAEFDFGKIQAWLRDDGRWHIEGDVNHLSGLCATYQLGIQFGTGKPGCANVEWILPPIFVTRKNQCNGSGAYHSGGSISRAAEERFVDINCAQRVLKCDGACN